MTLLALISLSNLQQSALLANVLGPDVLVVAGIIIFLFGGSQIPKIARSLGQAQKEFKSGQEEQNKQSDQKGNGSDGPGSGEQTK